MVSFKYFSNLSLKCKHSQCILKESHGPLMKDVSRLCGSAACLTNKEEVDKNLDRKILKVAILGKTNAGKSTLINQIIKLNLCDVSKKSHTTLQPIKAAFVHESTQIVFFDTPGVVSAKEKQKYNLSTKIPKWENSVLQQVDLIGLLYDASFYKSPGILFPVILNILKQVQEPKPIVLLVNKMDLVLNHFKVERSVETLQQKITSKTEKENLISRVFYISALKNQGVMDFTNYLLEKAVPGQWLIEEGKHSDLSVLVIVKNLLRAKFLNVLPLEVPYICSYEVEYLEENDLGEYICVALVSSKRPNHVKMIIRKYSKSLKSISKEIESDLYYLTGKVFRLRIVVQKFKLS